MSKITIKSIEPVSRPGKTTFWSCEDLAGVKLTVWDQVIADTIAQNLNVECEAEVKTSGNFINIRSFSASSGYAPSPVAQAAIAKAVPSVNQMSVKDISIVSQVCLKCAAEVYAISTQTTITELTLEFVDAYNAAVLKFEKDE